MSRVDDALQRLYESASLRDELTDDEAETLLKWAESEVARLDAANADDAAFTTQVDTLMDLVKSLNRYAGRQGQVTAQAAGDAVGSMVTQATTLGYTLDAGQIAGAATGDPTSTVAALTGLMRQTAPNSSSSSSGDHTE